MRYRIRYKTEIEVGSFTREEIYAKEAGGTDALLYASIICPEDGSYSIVWFSKDGRTGEELTEKEIFKAWLMLAGRLAKSSELDFMRRRFADETFQSFWRMIEKVAAEEPAS